MNPYSIAAVGDPNSKYGAVGHMPDGKRYVVFHRRYPHSVEKVWAAITEAEHLWAWAPEITFEPRLGGRVEMRLSGSLDAEPDVVTAVEEFDPPRALQLGGLRIELEPDDEGCLLMFSDILHFAGPRSDVEIMNAVLGGWHKFLDRLDAHVLGEPVDFEAAEPDYASREVVGRH